MGNVRFLHGDVVNNHVTDNFRVPAGNLLTAPEKETINQRPAPEI